jgi:hypothetical protein
MAKELGFGSFGSGKKARYRSGRIETYWRSFEIAASSSLS